MQPAWQGGRQREPVHSPVAENLRQALANYALVSPAGGVKHAPGVTLVSSGVRYAVFNAAILDEPVIATAEELTTRLITAASFFREMDMPWSCWVCRDHLTPPARPLAELILQRHRLRFIAEHMGLEADRLEAPHRKLPPLDVRSVATSETRRDFAAVTGEAFELPPAVGHQIYEGPGLWRGDYFGYVGYVGGRAVCTAATCSNGDSVGLYSVGTSRAYRGRGYAEAITRAVLEEARERYGTNRCVLQSTQAGLELYQRMGYRPVTTVLVYATL